MMATAARFLNNSRGARTLINCAVDTCIVRVGADEHAAAAPDDLMFALQRPPTTKLPTTTTEIIIAMMMVNNTHDDDDDDDCQSVSHERKN